MKNLKLALLGLVVLLVGVLPLSAFAEYEIDTGFYQKQALDEKQEQELRCLAKNIFYEAGGESFDGKLAVAQVTVNRANSGNFPNTICGVVKQKSAWQGRTVCQFSWFCTSKSKDPIPKDSDRYQESLQAARQVLLEGLGLKHLKDALYFHATHVNPNWGKVRVARIGNHVFYRDHK